MPHWVRVRGKRVNLDYAILAEEYEGSPDTDSLVPGGVRLTIETGRVLVLPPIDAEKILRAIDDEIEGPASGTDIIGRPQPKHSEPGDAVQPG